tara:strand:- start:8921 stop:10459 length:1539 start_codon:yes stop_codon:yes gene_type:complete
MIFSYDLEKRVLQGIMQHKERWEEISSFLSDNDFYSEDTKVNLSIFKLMRNSLDGAEKIDETILLQRIKQLGISFPDSIDIAEYVFSLSFHKISAEVFMSSVKELKKFTARRGIYDSCKEICLFVKKPDPTLKYTELVDHADSMYNENIRKFEMGDAVPVNLFSIMEEVIEDRGNNPTEEVGLMGPHERINDIYGSLLLAGNITCIVARAGVGKSSFAMDYCTKVAAKAKVKVLHFDNGEMSEEELIFRQCSAMTGIPVYLLQSGKWRTSSYKNMSPAQVVAKVRSAWDKIKHMEFYYENVAGMSVDEMGAALKRFYYGQVGRGKPLIFSFDYIKNDYGNAGGKEDSWLLVGKMVNKFKQIIHRELCFDGKPCVSMMTAVQSNRLGITTNRAAASIVDDESIMSLSDNIIHFISHGFILRKKVMEELQSEGESFGTHKLICVKARHLGKDAMRHIEAVELADGSKKQNFINLNFENFAITEKGDLVDMIHAQTSTELHEQEDDGSVPSNLYE